jgi:hypothetical protein
VSHVLLLYFLLFCCIIISGLVFTISEEEDAMRLTLALLLTAGSLSLAGCATDQGLVTNKRGEPSLITRGPDHIERRMIVTHYGSRTWEVCDHRCREARRLEAERDALAAEDRRLDRRKERLDARRERQADRADRLRARAERMRKTEARQQRRPTCTARAMRDPQVREECRRRGKGARH